MSEPQWRIVKRFEKQPKAEKWARAFDYARSLIGWHPLAVVSDGDGWAVAEAYVGDGRIKLHQPPTGDRPL